MATYSELPSNTKVWIYQSNKAFDDDKTMYLKAHVQKFVQQWVSHNVQLKAWGDVLHNRFVVLMVDESHEGVGGCSIDTSVAFIKSIETDLGVDMLDRWNFAYKDGVSIKSVAKDDFVQLYQDGQITDDTIVFNNLVTTKGDFEQKWAVKLSDSWHRRLV